MGNSRYNYDNFSPDDYDLLGDAGPSIGDAAADFTLETTEGETSRLLDFTGQFLVLELGSISCPLFNGRRKTMLHLDDEFAEVSFAVLYIREAHPGAAIPAHRCFANKKACAMRLASDYGDSRRVFIDSLDGSAHEAYGALPNAVYVIDQLGVVRFKAAWNNPSSVGSALSALLDGQSPSQKVYFRPPKPWIVRDTVQRAGAGSAADFLRGLPRLIWNVGIKRNFRTMFNA